MTFSISSRLLSLEIMPGLIQKRSCINLYILTMTPIFTELSPGRRHCTLQVGFVLIDHQFYMQVLQIVVCPIVLFLLAIVLSVLLRFTASDYLPWYLQTLLIFNITVYIMKTKKYHTVGTIPKFNRQNPGKKQNRYR